MKSECWGKNNPEVNSIRGKRGRGRQIRLCPTLSKNTQPEYSECIKNKIM